MDKLRILLALVLMGLGAPATSMAADGTVVIKVAEFTSEVELKEKIRKQLEGGGVEWGQTGNRLVITTVNKQFVGVTINQLTRFGSSASLSLPAGDYTIDVVGLIPEGGLSVAKVLSKGGYFNEGVMAFHVSEGNTTTLDIKPVIRKASTFLLKFFLPEYVATATLDGQTSEPVSLNARTAKSTAWDNYNGDLKFKK